MSQQLIDRTVEIEGGIALHYVEAGEGKPLIIIPSWSLTGGWYQHQLHGLSHNRRVISLDMRGHAFDARPNHLQVLDEVLTYETHADVQRVVRT